MGRSSEPHNQVALVVLVLAFSYLLISSSAIPVTRSRSLLRGIPGAHLHHLMQGANLMKEKKKSRKVVELDDYPGSGANDRHTPRPFGRGCSDC